MIMTGVLRSAGFRVESAASGEEALNKIRHAAPDLVLLDYDMPGLGGLETLKILREREPYVWVIFVSTQNDPRVITRCLNTGADDYIRDPFEPLELLARVRAQLRMKEITDRLISANQKLRELADTDDLTGLFNMRSIYQKLEIEISRAKRSRRAVAAVMMDMDHFKTVNDQNDHLFGSFVLSEVGRLLKGSIRDLDFAARYGGDEFLIVLSEPTVEGAGVFTERLRKKIEATTFTNDSCSIQLTASFGLAAIEPSIHSLDSKSLVRAADHALYEAKQAGRNRVVVARTHS